MTTLIGRARPRRAASLPVLPALAGAFRRLWARIVANYRVTRTRRLLLALDDQTLRDVGLSRADIEMHRHIPCRTGSRPR